MLVKLNHFLKFWPKKRRKWETSPNDILDRLNSYTSWHSIDSTCWYFTIYTCKYTPEKFIVCPVIPSFLFSTVPSFSSSWGAWKLGFKVFAFDLAPRRAWYVRIERLMVNLPHHAHENRPTRKYTCTHTHTKQKICCQWDGFLAFFWGLMQVRQTWLQAIYHLRILKVETYEPWFSKHRQSCNNFQVLQYRSIYHIDHSGTVKWGWLDYIWNLLMYQPCTAYFQKSETTWNTQSSRLDLFPSLTFGCSFSPQEKKHEKTCIYCIYYIRRTKIHTTNHIYHKTANKNYRHFSPGKFAKILV